MLEKLKKIAGKISEDYLLKNIDMNTAVAKAARDEKMNDEIVRRICEFANQNVYLSLFSDPVKRGNIVFDLADPEQVLNKLKEKSMDTADYLTPPTDYRLQLEDVITDTDAIKNLKEKTVDPVEKKLRALVERVRLNEKLKQLLNTVKTLEFEEKTAAEKNFTKIANDCKALVFNGESFGDMAKLAMRYAKEQGFGLEKTAKLYEIVHDYLKQKGFRVNESLTKTSSMKVNMKADIYQPLEEYNLNVMKLAGLREMKKSLETATATLSESIRQAK